MNRNHSLINEAEDLDQSSFPVVFVIPQYRSIPRVVAGFEEALNPQVINDSI